MTDVYQFDSEQTAWLRSMYVLAITAFTGNFVFTIFNYFAYYRRLHYQNILIHLFYLGAFFLCLVHIIIFVILAIDPDKDIYLF